MGYSKADVRTYRPGYGSTAYPAVCIKVYRFPDSSKVAAGLGVESDNPNLEKALEFHWQSECATFMESAELYAEECLGKGLRLSQAGRSGGWLLIDGLPELSNWDAVQLGKWRRFEKMVFKHIEFAMSTEAAVDNIQANEWLKPGSEHYNFIDIDGQTKCIADLKAEAIAAGFGPVVRKEEL